MDGNLVRDWMTPDPINIPSVCTLIEAYRLMMDHKIRRLLVVDQGVLVGVVTLEDLRRKMPASLGLYRAVPGELYDNKTPVSHVMTKNPKTIEAGSPLIQAAHLLLDFQISSLPVIDEGKPVGIITESDVLRALVVQIEA